MSPLLRLRVIATKEDNPWLPEDVGTRPGVCIKMASGYTLADLDVEQTAISDAKNGARAIVMRLRREGLIT